MVGRAGWVFDADDKVATDESGWIERNDRETGVYPEADDDKISVSLRVGDRSGEVLRGEVRDGRVQRYGKDPLAGEAALRTKFGSGGGAIDGEIGFDRESGIADAGVRIGYADENL